MVSTSKTEGSNLDQRLKLRLVIELLLDAALGVVHLNLNIFLKKNHI